MTPPADASPPEGTPPTPGWWRENWDLYVWTWREAFSGRTNYDRFAARIIVLAMHASALMLLVNVVLLVIQTRHLLAAWTAR